jgi:hypothetical protein
MSAFWMPRVFRCRIGPPRWWQGIWRRKRSLIFRGEVEGRRIAVLAFDLRHSDLPLQVAFPLLWANLIDWLAPGAGSAVPAQALPGEAA